MDAPETTWKSIRLSDPAAASTAAATWRMGIEFLQGRLRYYHGGKELAMANQSIVTMLKDIRLYGEDDCGLFLDNNFLRILDKCQQRLFALIDQLLPWDIPMEREWKRVIKQMLSITPEDRICFELAVQELTRAQRAMGGDE